MIIHCLKNAQSHGFADKTNLSKSHNRVCLSFPRIIDFGYLVRQHHLIYDTQRLITIPNFQHPNNFIIHVINLIADIDIQFPTEISVYSIFVFVVRRLISLKLRKNVIKT